MPNISKIKLKDVNGNETLYDIVDSGSREDIIEIREDINALESNKVNKSGDHMTGALYIDSGVLPELVLGDTNANLTVAGNLGGIGSKSQITANKDLEINAEDLTIKANKISIKDEDDNPVIISGVANPSGNTDVVNKQYLNDIGNTKVTKITSASDYKRVYAVDASGSQIMINADPGPSITGAIPIRGTNGVISVPLQPSTSYNATSKKYVDDLIQGVQLDIGDVEGDVAEIQADLAEGTQAGFSYNNSIINVTSQESISYKLDGSFVKIVTGFYGTPTGTGGVLVNAADMGTIIQPEQQSGIKGYGSLISLDASQNPDGFYHVIVTDDGIRVPYNISTTPKVFVLEARYKREIQ